MKPSDHSGTTMLTLSSHVIYMQFREFKYVHPSTNVKKNDVWRESMFSKKNNSPFHLGKISRISIQTSADSWIRQASKWLGPWHQAPLLPAPWSSWFWGARGAVWMNLPVSALNGKHHSGFTIWNDKKTTCLLVPCDSQRWTCIIPFFLPKIIHSKCQRWYKQPCFKPLCQHVCQPFDIENFPSVSIPPAYKTFQFRCRLESAPCLTKV